jgi:hypothetical protein
MLKAMPLCTVTTELKIGKARNRRSSFSPAQGCLDDMLDKPGSLLSSCMD